MEVLQNEMIRQMIASASNHLQNHKKQINDLNIFPVPDGDTGTNMSMTFGAATAETLRADENTPAGELIDILAKSSLRNARGNSGVILSQILRGLAGAVHGAESIGIEEIKQAAQMSRDTAYRAVMKPTEGTILTVVREMAEYAEGAAAKQKKPVKFIKAILDAANESLQRTPEILPVLKEAGVVDAGGKGVVTLLEGAYLALCGKPVSLDDAAEAAQPVTVKRDVALETEDIKFHYCTEFLIHKSPERQATQFKAAIRSKGDCMLVIDEDEIVKVHIHTNHPGFVIEQALKLGELTNLKIDNMKFQHEEIIRKEDSPVEHRKKYGMVAVSAGDGLTEVFESIGVDVIVEGGQTMNPSTQDLLNAVQEIAADVVFILPNNKNIILAAQQVESLADQKVIVIPSRNIPQGISAALAFDADQTAEDNFAAMQEMMETVQCGQVTFAARNSTVDGVKIRKNDILGMRGSEILCTGKDINTVAKEVVHQMIHDDAGVITLYYGDGIEKAQAEDLEQELKKHYEYLDVSLIYGGQPVYYYFIAVE